jgi:hypothetical protein
MATGRNEGKRKKEMEYKQDGRKIKGNDQRSKIGGTKEETT